MPVPSRISDVIAQDLRRKIDSGQEIPCPLTIAALGDYYQVSQSPIRTAIEQLVAWGFLNKLDNGRLAINSEKRGQQTD